MNYYIDTEFLEGTQAKRILGIPYGKTKPTIDLISIGIVAEDGREYYAISRDFNLKEAWNRWQWKKVASDNGAGHELYKEYWIRENVLKPLYWNMINSENLTPLGLHGRIEYNWPGYGFSYNNLKLMLKKHGKSNAQISDEVKDFVNSTRFDDKVFRSYTDPEFWDDNIIDYCSDHNIAIEARSRKVITNPIFYGYYADYDWVVFCWLFGRMVDLPDGFPMYCRDLKQMLDEKIEKSWKDVEMSTWGHTGIENIKNHPNYPKQANDHSAIHDARWNYELYKFIQTI